MYVTARFCAFGRLDAVVCLLLYTAVFTQNSRFQVLMPCCAVSLHSSGNGFWFRLPSNRPSTSDARFKRLHSALTAIMPAID